MSHKTSSTSSYSGSLRSRKQWECPYCSKNFPDDAKSVQCDTCGNWVCLPCSKVNEELYDVIHKLNDNEDGTSGFKWVCKLDERSLPTLKEMNTTLSSIMQSNNERFDKIEEQVRKVEDSIGEKVSEEVIGLKEKLMADISVEIDKKLEQKSKEENDRKFREMNLCLFNVPVSDSTDPQERKKHDLSVLNSLFQAVVKDDKITEPQIKNIFRLKSTNVSSEGAEGQLKDPVMKVTFVSKHELRLFITNARHIKDNEALSKEMQNIMVSRDMSPREREINKQLRKDLTEMNKEGKKFTIRNGKIVPISGRPRSDSPDSAPPSV